MYKQALSGAGERDSEVTSEPTQLLQYPPPPIQILLPFRLHPTNLMEKIISNGQDLSKWCLEKDDD